MGKSHFSSTLIGHLLIFRQNEQKAKYEKYDENVLDDYRVRISRIPILVFNLNKTNIYNIYIVLIFYTDCILLQVLYELQGKLIIV